MRVTLRPSAIIDPVYLGGRVLAAVDLMERLKPLLVPDAPTQKTLREFFDREARQRLSDGQSRDHSQLPEERSAT